MLALSYSRRRGYASVCVVPAKHEWFAECEYTWHRPFDSLASCFDGAYELRFCTVRAAANCSPVRAR